MKKIILALLLTLVVPSAYALEIEYTTKSINVENAWKNDKQHLMLDVNDLQNLFIDDYNFNFDGWQLTLLGGNFAVTAEPNSTLYKRDGFAINLESTPIIKDQIIWVPLEEISKLFHITIEEKTNEKIILAPPATQATKEEQAAIYKGRLTSVFNNIKFPRPAIAHFEDILIPTNFGYVPARIYNSEPEHPDPKNALIYIHGGAFTLGSIASSDHVLRDLANLSSQRIISLDYRMPPDYPFPAAWNDMYDATLWISEHADELGIKKDAIAIGGDSAGANIASGVVKMARDNKSIDISAQFLFYPVVDGEFEMWKDIFASPEDAKNPYVTLTNGELINMPKSYIYLAEEDIFRAEGEVYAQALKDAKVDTTLVIFPDTKHGFLGNTPEARRKVAEDLKNFK